jgi:hypothetical protein
MIADIAWHKVPALRASRLIKTIATTPLRAWLLHVGPSGLRSFATIANPPASNFQSFLQFVD